MRVDAGPHDALGFDVLATNALDHLRDLADGADGFDGVLAVELVSLAFSGVMSMRRSRRTAG
jgi:hypothetical protein